MGPGSQFPNGGLAGGKILEFPVSGEDTIFPYVSCYSAIKDQVFRKRFPVCACKNMIISPMNNFLRICLSAALSEPQQSRIRNEIHIFPKADPQCSHDYDLSICSMCSNSC